MSATTLSPHQVLLLAVYFATHANLGALAQLVSLQGTILNGGLVLRVLLAYLPETVPSSEYVDFLRHLVATDGQTSNDLAPASDTTLDTTAVDGLSAEEAARKVRKLRLRSLDPDVSPADVRQGLTRFLIDRAYCVDEEAGLLSQLPGLLSTFAEHDATIKSFAVSVVLPWYRRNCEYHPRSRCSQSLREFEAMSNATAIATLLSETSNPDIDPGSVGRDIRGLITPWLHNEARWKRIGEQEAAPESEDAPDSVVNGWICPGWESMLEWLTNQASQNWSVAVQALVQWMGPDDMDLGPYGDSWLGDDRIGYLRQRYFRAGLAATYMVSERSIEALNGAYMMSARLRSSALIQESSPLRDAALGLQPVSEDAIALMNRACSGVLRNGVLKESNPLTSPTEPAVLLLQALILSAFLITGAGCPFTVRQAGELHLLGDEREQLSTVKSLVRAADRNQLKADDGFWARVRYNVLWLHDWGQPLDDDRGSGLFGRVKREVIEAEILDALLANSRLSLARSIYEDTPLPPLTDKKIQGAVVSAAMQAYDNASNPNRTRGGLKKCDEIVHAFPDTLPPSHEAARRIECLLKATNTLCDYRLVLKQGSPFSPVVLRTHSDPISIIDKVLRQNPKSYTKLQDFLDLGANFIKAGLALNRSSRSAKQSGADDQNRQLLIAERRIIAMAVEAALNEDDFETAYSYVVSRLEGLPNLPPPKDTPVAPGDHVDQWSWAAALQAGQYVRTSRSMRPTHIGTASGNPEVRHLEQRLECLATALRIAPAAQLQEILKTFRRCEEQLDAALRLEAASEDAWDAAADMHKAAPIPGAFLNESRSAARAGIPAERTRPAATGDDAPMSLFDLTARIASQNLSALSGLQRAASTASNRTAEESHAPWRGGGGGGGGARAHQVQESAAPSGGAGAGSASGEAQQPRARKRDQLRDAAVGTLVSGVGWLVGAQPVQQQQQPPSPSVQHHQQQQSPTMRGGGGDGQADEEPPQEEQQQQQQEDDWDW